MARSSSIINVSIIGDAKKLIGAVGAADKATGGLIGSAGKVLIAGVGVKKGFDLIGDSLAESDRVGDAMQRLNTQISKTDVDKLSDTADNFADIGASRGDMLALEAAYADLATSAGIAAPDIAANAEALAASAVAAGLVHDEDPAAIIDAIGKAAGGSTRGLKPYGIDLTEAAVQQRAMKDTGKELPSQLTDTELAGARVALMLEGFNPLLVEATEGTGDFAQKQDELGAKFETVAGKIGAGLEGPLGDALDWINDMIDAIPGAIDGWNLLGLAIDGALRDMLGPLARVRDAVEGLLGLFADLAEAGSNSFQVSPGRAPRSDRDTSNSQRREDERNGGHSGLGGP